MTTLNLLFFIKQVSHFSVSWDIFIIRNLRIFMQCELFIKASCILYIRILATSHPSLLQQNPGVWLQELSNKPLFEDNILFQNPILHQLNIWCV